MNFIKKYKIKITLISVIVISCLLVTYFTSPSRSSNFNKYKIPQINANEKYRVINVIDGDTFEVNLNNEGAVQKPFKVRMLGMDTPETVDPRKPIQCYGKEASDKTKELLEGHFVTLETDNTQSVLDKYGRILAYVYVDDNNNKIGQTSYGGGNVDSGTSSSLFINEFLLKEGYAHEYIYYVPYTKQKEFKKLEKDASKNKRGLWGKCGVASKGL